MTIMVTGGAGYIGSHTVAELVEHGEQVIVVDKLSTGHRSAVIDAPLYEIDIRDSDKLRQIFRDHDIEAVVHFAADSLVGESVQKPLKYYEDNVGATTRLLSVMVECGVKNIVFSSTAAVYGEPEKTPILENTKTVPKNPYGETKLAIEKMFYWSYQAYGLKSISLRYFNACGAHETLPIGEDHRPETHLIPNILMVPLLQRESISVFGNDYPTEDGTCVRDYVHVMDLASAHRLAVQRLCGQNGSVEVFNLGSGNGYSVQEVISAARDVTGHRIPVVYGARRAGDPAVLVASSERAKQVLLWKPKYDNLSKILSSAWRWHQTHPHGYEE